MPIDIIYSNTDDYYIASSSASYATARSTAATAYPVTDTIAGSGQQFSGGLYGCFQAPLHFDTTTLVGAPTAIELSLSVSSVFATRTHEVREHTWAGASTSSWVAGADLASKTLFASKSVSVTGRQSFVSGLTAIPSSATYGLIVAAEQQRTNVAPTGQEYIVFSSSNASGTTDDPYLAITTASVAPVTVNNATHAHSASQPVLASFYTPPPPAVLVTVSVSHGHTASAPDIEARWGFGRDGAAGEWTFERDSAPD